MIQALLLLLLRVYRATLSPLLGNVCRFEPSCSRYATAVISEWGALRGSWLTVRRLGKCHPFHPGGFDPPPRREAHPEGAPAGAPRCTHPHPHAHAHENAAHAPPAPSPHAHAHEHAGTPSAGLPAGRA